MGNLQSVTIYFKITEKDDIYIKGPVPAPRAANTTRPVLDLLTYIEKEIRGTYRLYKRYSIDESARETFTLRFTLVK